MDATLAEKHYLGLTPTAAERQLLDLIDWAELNGGGFSVLWHPNTFDPAQAPGWGRLFYRFVDAVRARGGRCVTCDELAREAAAMLPAKLPD